MDYGEEIEKNRKLSKAEEKRLAKYKEREKQMIEDGYEKHDITISLDRKSVV